MNQPIADGDIVTASKLNNIKQDIKNQIDSYNFFQRIKKKTS